MPVNIGHSDFVKNTMEFMVPAGQFSGTPVKELRAADMLFVESRFAPKHNLKMHAHESACVCLVVDGSFDEVYGQRRRTCVPSTLMFRPSGERHGDQFDDRGAVCFNLEIGEGLFDRLGGDIRLRRESVEIEDARSRSLARQLYAEFVRMDDVSALAMEGLALELLAGVSRGSRRSSHVAPRWLERAREILHLDYAESITVEGLAGMVDIHPVHLARTFHRVYRCTVAEYVRRRRVEFAAEQLSRTALPLARIALDAGFAHQSHFSAVFKRATGLTPANYRSIFRSR